MAPSAGAPDGTDEADAANLEAAPWSFRARAERYIVDSAVFS